MDQLASHDRPTDCWIAVDGRVFDVTRFLNDHPGGKKVLTRMCGKDATEQFHALHSASVLDKVGGQ